MTLAFYSIAVTFAVTMLWGWLREARAEIGRLYVELARARGEHEAREQAVRDEYAAYAHGAAVAMACLFTVLASSCWPHPAGRPAGTGQDGSTADPDRGAVR